MRKMYGYARVSSKDQNLDRQLIALRDFGIDDRDIIREKASGKSLNREAYQTLRNQLLREGDTLVIVSLDRLSRNKLHIKQELEYYRSRNIRVMILDMPTTLCQVNEGQEWIIEMINAILIEVLASMAEQERIRTLNRQAEGILAAQLQGKHLGRPKMKIPEGWGEIYMLWKSGEITAVEAMKRSGLKKSTFYKLAKLTDENYTEIKGNAQYTVEKGKYITTPKSGKGRLVILNQPILDLLKEWKREQTKWLFSMGLPHTGFIFTQDDGEMLNPNAPTKYLSKFGKRYNFPGLHPHTLRHTMATVSIANGADVVSVSKKLGHAAPSITLNIYSHANQEAQLRANKTLESALYKKA